MDFFLLCVYLMVFSSVLSVFTNHLLHKLQNHPPTPFLCLPVIGHFHLFRKPLHQRLSQITKRFGPVVFLQIGSRPVLLVSSPSVAEECFTKNDVVFANRPHFLTGKVLGCNYTSLTWAPYGYHWRNLRRISSLKLLSSHRLQTLSHIRVDEIIGLIKSLMRDSIQPVNLRSTFFELTFNVMMRMIDGKRYYGKDVENKEDPRRSLGMVSEAIRGSGQLSGDYMPFINWFGLSKGMETRLMAMHAKRNQFIQDLIEKHRKTNSDVDERTQKTMIQILLSLQETDPDYYTDEMIRNFMLVLIEAGTGTTVGTMEWAMSHLINNPQILKKAQEEIDNLVSENRLLNESDISQLPYLQGIINETLRIHPVLPILFPHESLEECSVGGYRVPSKTTLFVNVWAIHNDRKLWVDPEMFNPERFEGSQRSESGGSFKFMPFGAGRRKCPGEGLAIRIMGLVVGSLIQCFDWERASEKMVDMSGGTAFTKKEALVAKCQPRPSMMNLVQTSMLRDHVSLTKQVL